MNFINPKNNKHNLLVCDNDIEIDVMDRPNRTKQFYCNLKSMGEFKSKNLNSGRSEIVLLQGEPWKAKSKTISKM